MLAWHSLPLIVLFFLPVAAISNQSLKIPFNRIIWMPDGADALWMQPNLPAGVEFNGNYIRAPRGDASRTAWMQGLLNLRDNAIVETHRASVAVHFHGVRAWTRMDPSLGRSLSLKPLETLSLSFEARWESGNPEVCSAFDYLDSNSMAWKSWSTVLSTVQIPEDHQWHSLTVTTQVPPNTPPDCFANIILGQDATHNPATGVWEMRNIECALPRTHARQLAVNKASNRSDKPDMSIYSRKDLAWASRNFTCFFLFIYDESFYDRNAGKYRVDEFLDAMDRDYGGIDSVVLWHAYPRIGVDPRNQFDFYRDMPGGLAGLKSVVGAFHNRNVKVYINYNPWDTGTRREKLDDSHTLATLTKEIDADGVFLDTMTAAPDSLRKVMDAHRKGVIFEPEGSPPISQLGVCSSSWAQWLADYPEPGLLYLKWIEPRHMQHQIRRWDREHWSEIEEAFFNGSGILVWENVFGTWNPWSVKDKYIWRKASTILRAYSELLSSKRPSPFEQVGGPGVYANKWRDAGVDLYLMTYRGINEGDELELHLPRIKMNCRVFDLWQGEELFPAKDGSIHIRKHQLGALAITRMEVETERIHRLRKTLNGQAIDPFPSGIATYSEPNKPAPTLPASINALPNGMVAVNGGKIRMLIKHERRECGCYPDPGTPPDRINYFVFGSPFNETLTHDYTVHVKSFAMDRTLVTNGEYAQFVKESGYRPMDTTNYLKYWQNGACPTEPLNHPVTWIDIDDARAYAKWAGKRLPTEEEWQLAAQGTDGRKWPWGGEFSPNRCNRTGTGTTPVGLFPNGASPCGCLDMVGSVWQLTESERNDGHTRSLILRGGSWFDAPGSGWYVHGGPQPLDSHARFILMYPGLDRCATVGFRCAKDVDTTQR